MELYIHLRLWIWFIFKILGEFQSLWKQKNNSMEQKIQGRYMCVNLPHRALSRRSSPDLQTFAVCISCVGTTKLVLIYTIVGSMKNTNPSQQNKHTFELRCQEVQTYCTTCTTCGMLLPVNSTANSLWANLRGVKLQLYWFFTALISWRCFKLLKALSGIVLNLEQEQNRGIFNESEKVTVRYHVSCSWSAPCTTSYVLLWVPWKQQLQNQRTVFYSRFQHTVHCKHGICFKVVCNWHSQV